MHGGCCPAVHRMSKFSVSAAAIPTLSCGRLADVPCLSARIQFAGQGLSWLQTHGITLLAEHFVIAGDWRSVGCGPTVYGWPGPPARLAVAFHH